MASTFIIFKIKGLLKWAIMPIFLLMILLIPKDNVKAVSDDSTMASTFIIFKIASKEW